MTSHQSLENIAEIFYSLRKIDKHILVTINGTFFIDDDWDYNTQINPNDTIQLEYKISGPFSHKEIVFRFKMNEMIGYTENKNSTILYIEPDITIHVQQSDTLPLLIEKDSDNIKKFSESV